MLKKLQSLKAKKGFTLVELIVVIAIIAVLAAILVPTMMGYVTQSRVTSADSTAQQLKDTVGNAMVEMDTKGYKVPVTGTVYLGGTSGGSATCTLDSSLAAGTDITADYPQLVDAIKKKINEDYTFTKAFKAVVYISDRKAVGCVYCADGSIADTSLSGITWSILKSGNYSWPSTDGIDSSGNVIGTSPKVIKS